MNLSHIVLSVVIPAAGIGSRFGSSLPKQYSRIGTKTSTQTVLEYTLQKFLELSFVQEVIVVLAPEDFYFQTLACSTHPKIKTTLGGATRAESVLAGLEAQNEGIHWTLVHDAARPCIPNEDILKLIQFYFALSTEQQNHGAILAYPLTDTIKQSQAQYNQVQNQQIKATLDRNRLWAALTPQLFPTQLLKQALSQALDQQQTITDEASAIEWFGFHPYLVEGKRENIKITHQEDLDLAHYYLNKQGYFMQENPKDD